MPSMISGDVLDIDSLPGSEDVFWSLYSFVQAKYPAEGIGARNWDTVSLHPKML